MDVPKENRIGLHFELAETIGLKRLLGPDTVKVCGFGAFRVYGTLALSSLFAVSALCPAGFYSLANDVLAFGLYFGCVTNFLFCCYKIAVFLFHSSRIRKTCDEISSPDFASYDENTLRYWNGRFACASGALIAFTVVGASFWVSSPVVFSDVTLTVRNRNDSCDAYRLNVFNVYLGVSDVTYNRHFPVFYLVEVGLIVFPYVLFITLFDLVVVCVSSSFCCRLEMISGAIRALGHSSSRSTEGSTFDNNDLINQEDKHDSYDDLRIVINDHQKVLKSMSDYYAIFCPAILTEIFVGSSSHAVLWFIAASSIFSGELGDSIVSIKLIIALPIFTFHLFMNCYLFGTINEIKESFIFALYSCNWTGMDIKSKKLILLTMKMNNANNLKIKFTNTRIVNLEMFTFTMRVCYSIFSMLIKYDQNKKM